MTSSKDSFSEKKAGSVDIATPSSGSGVELGHITEEDKQKVLRKMDWHLLPFISLLYLLSFL
jgi:hypothetical protein